MTFAVISDVHANLEALTAVMDALEELPHDSLLCLGDLVGYNPDPERCAGLVLAQSALIVRGNHDKAVAGLMDLDWFNPVAAGAVRWTRRIMQPATVARLRGLAAGPVEVGAGAPGVLACHGSPFDEDAYLLSREHFRTALDRLAEDHPDARICLFGHTHVPGVVEERAGRVRLIGDPEVRLAPDARYLLNPGSVGQPRDGNPRASFAILDTDRGSWKTIRVAYPIRETRRKIAAAGLPPELAERLGAGW